MATVSFGAAIKADGKKQEEYVRCGKPQKINKNTLITNN